MMRIQDLARAVCNNRACLQQEWHVLMTDLLHSILRRRSKLGIRNSALDVYHARHDLADSLRDEHPHVDELLLMIFTLPEVARIVVGEEMSSDVAGNNVDTKPVPAQDDDGYDEDDDDEDDDDEDDDDDDDDEDVDDEDDDDEDDDEDVDDEDVDDEDDDDEDDDEDVDDEDDESDEDTYTRRLEVVVSNCSSLTRLMKAVNGLRTSVMVSTALTSVFTCVTMLTVTAMWNSGVACSRQ
jgi:hypothetical protein